MGPAKKFFFLVAFFGASAAFAAESPRVLSESAARDLGGKLFFDGRLARDGKRACAGCHLPEFGWTDREPKSLGVFGRRAPRNAPTVIGVADVEAKGVLFRDGRVRSLPEFVFHPVTNSDEMDMTVAEVEKRISEVPVYGKLFAAAFGSPEVTFAKISEAIAVFLRTIRFAPSGTPVERPGFAVFEKAGCAACHAGARLTDDSFHATGTGRAKELGGSGDPGRGKITGKPEEEGAFRTPSLLNVALTPPYFHDGSANTLSEIIRFYEQEMPEGVRIDPRRPVLKLSPQDRAALLSFLESLNATEGGFTRPEVP
ncbi:MAG: cytochrome c peroxidase [Bdellovibrionota bacterium]